MNKKLKVLILEDDLMSYRVIVHELEKLEYEFEFKRAIYKIEFIDHLNNFVPDLILSDYNLPDMNGFDALTLAHQTCGEASFIFVTGTIGEEIAADTILSGANGFVLKNNFTRLGPVVDQVLNNRGPGSEYDAELRRIKKYISHSNIDAAQVKKRCAEIKRMLDKQMESLKE